VAEIQIYTTPFCPYCHRAKALLQRKGVPFDEIDVMMSPGKRKEMRERAAGGNTVPQIFIDGSDELIELDQDGRLDPLLGIGS
jgi:glutaredoxin 3